jgi:hypothetical protein
MSEAEQGKVCPHCAETIRALAKVCPHCGRSQSRSAIYLDVLVGNSFGRLFGKRKKIMNEGVETKPCAFCAEPIRVAARVCPYCRNLQPRWRSKKQLEAWGSLVMLLIMGCGFMFSIHLLFGPGRDFEPFQNQIKIINSEMHFSQTTNGNFISTIGQIRNDSSYAWKDLQLEVQYFDKDAHMIDTRTEDHYGEIIPAGATQAFRLRGPADKPESAYSIQKVFVRSAKDSSKWP